MSVCLIYMYIRVLKYITDTKTNKKPSKNNGCHQLIIHISKNLTLTYENNYRHKKAIHVIGSTPLRRKRQTITQTPTSYKSQCEATRNILFRINFALALSLILIREQKDNRISTVYKTCTALKYSGKHKHLVNKRLSPNTSLAGESGGTQNIVNVKQDSSAHGRINIKL